MSALPPKADSLTGTVMSALCQKRILMHRNIKGAYSITSLTP